MSNTEIEADNLEFDLGTISKGDTRTVKVSIKNIGNSPFIIFDIRASCGCTNIAYDKRPIDTDSTTELSITYNAEDNGYFNKTVSVYENIE